MNDEKPSSDFDVLRQAWIEALLQALQPEDHEQRVADLLERLDGPRVARQSGMSNRDSHPWLWRWKPMAIAAATLLVVFIVYQARHSNSATAAVTRSLRAISQSVTRQYDLDVKLADPELGEYAMSSEVYVRGRGAFVIRHRGIAGDIWLGCNGDGRFWFIPPTGEVLQGDATDFYSWLDARWDNLKYPRSERNTPFLHVASALEIMSERCKLTQLPDEAVRLADGQEVWCEHIRGIPVKPRMANPPRSIDLWLSQDLDIPIQVVAHWSAPDPSLDSLPIISSVKLIYRGQPNLPLEWFEAESHLLDD